MRVIRIRHAVAAALLFAPPALAREAPVAAAQAPRAAAQGQSRFIEMEGGRNFRDVGGYRTADGHTVRWHALYRSGSMARLTPAAQARFDALKVTSIIDLRSTDERKGDPDRWQQDKPYGYWARDYSLGSMDLSKFMADPANRTADGMRRMMTQGYRTLPVQLAPNYRELFSRLSAPHEGAVVVNCTAGKDRTGIGAALVLTALGVPYATVRQDFLLSNNAPGMNTLGRDLAAPMPAGQSEMMKVVAGVEGQYLDAAFDQLTKNYGSIQGYLRKELGVGPKQIAVLRRNMLTR